MKQAALPILICSFIAMEPSAIAINHDVVGSDKFYALNDSILAGQPNMRIILGFFHRYTDSLLCLPVEERKQRMGTDGVRISVGNLDRLKQITDSTRLMIATHGNRHIIRLQNEPLTFFEMSVPRSYELMVGKNKKEIENDFIKEITDFAEPDISLQDPPDFGLTDSLSLYTENGPSFHIPEIAFKRYYRKDEQGYSLLVDPVFPEESAYNLFLSDRVSGQYTLQLKLRKYGFKKESFEVSLKKWIYFCEYTGCECYVGIEKVDNGKIHAAIFAVNTIMQYNHVLYVTITQESLTRQEGDITGELHVYIPTDNIKELIGEYQEKNKTYKINIKKR
ncbi:hypothetical protein [Parabacteroides johnsonii]|uniref:hypothetical protein n=1 Tax=Parabacteroides johnsonii TaxID=387661 RepID=UPI00242A9D70|nr:hypothetical protein [Parabacteroides johnsonii]MBS6225180.1 hypothetical protein [Parabacteroides johnsonii]